MMFCGRCGNPIVAGARFCSACGAPVTAAQTGPSWTAAPTSGDWVTRLQRPRANRMVAGVCAGLAQHYHWDLTWVRVITVLIAVFSSGAGLVAYLVFWIVMPEEPWALPQATTSSYPGPPPPPVPPSHS